MPEFVLGLDVGTTSAQAMVVDLTGQVLGRAKTRLETQHTLPGRAEQDPRAVWEVVQSILSAALSDAGCGAADLATMGVTTQRSSVVIWDRKTAEPLTPLILWMDLRGLERAATLLERGFIAAPHAAVAKLEAALREVPNGQARAQAGELAWGTLDSFLIYRLTGGAVHTTDYSNAWSTCYLDLGTLRGWNEALLDFQGLPLSLFPDLCDTYGELGATASSVIGAEVPIGALVADQQSGMFAHHAFSAGDWKATYGTSATLMMSTGPVPDFTSKLTPMLQYGKGDESLFACEGMVVSAGTLIDWLVRDLGLFGSVEDLLAAAAAAGGSDGVAIVPALQGLGAPHNDSTRRASIVGLSGASTRSEIAFAALESIAFRIREIAQSAGETEGITLGEDLPVDGGLTASDLMLQIQADILGRPVTRHVEPEATTLGACVAAALGAGLVTKEGSAELARVARRFEPRQDVGEADARFEHWRSLTGMP